MAEALAPSPGAVVGTGYVASQIDVTTTWVAEMVRNGEIPGECLLAGTGTGKPWKFHRSKIDA
jgi:hypothetical protein